MKRTLLFSLIFGSLLQFTGCGGGGGGGGSAPPPSPVTITGKAVKGAINGADVYAYKMLGDGTADTTALDHTVTDATGAYTLTVPAGSGPVIIAVRGNSTAKYVNETDPAGSTLNYTASEELEAVVIVNSTSIQNQAVTPLTDMVADLLRTFYTSPTASLPKDLQTAITTASSVVGSMAGTLGVQDITNPSDAGYKKFLTLFTQYMIDHPPAGTTQVNAEFAAERFITAAMNDVTTLNADLTAAYNHVPPAIVTSNGMTPPPPLPSRTPPVFTGTGMTVTLSTSGTLPSGSMIGAIDVTLNLPAGVSVKASPSPLNAAVLVPDAGVVVLQGAAASASNQIVTTTYVPGATNKVVIRLANANGLATGAFATVNCDVATGSNPSTTGFSVSSNVAGTTGVFDLNTAALPGISVTYGAVASSTPPASPGAVVTLSATGTLPTGTLVGAIDVTLNLPAGVSVKATPSPLNAAILVPDAGVIVLQGAAASASSQMLTATYVQGATNQVVVRLVNANGLPVGAFAKVNCDVASGSAPSATGFSITPNVAGTTGVFDLNTAALSGITVNYSVVMQ